MDKEQLRVMILEKSIKYAGSVFPKVWGEQFFGAGPYEPFETEAFFENLAFSLEKNGAVSNSPEANEVTKSGSKATLFAASVLTNMYMEDALCVGIDNVFYEPQNNELFGNMSAEEKQQFCNDLKAEVAEKFAVKAETEKGQALVNNLKKCFEDAATLREDRELAEYLSAKDNKPIEASIFAPEDTNFNINFFVAGSDMLEEGMSVIFALNSNLQRGLSIEESAQAVRQRNDYNSIICNILVDSFEEGAAELSNEQSVIERSTESITVLRDNTFNVNPVQFVEDYKAGKVTAEEKAWAEDLFLNSIGLEENDLQFIRLDGKPMFKEGDLGPEKRADNIVDIVAASLSAKEVTFKKDNTERLINPTIKSHADESEKGVLGKMLQFVKDIFNIGPKEMYKLWSMNKENVKASKDFTKKTIERISINELSGANALKKFVPSQKENTPSIEKNGKSFGG